MLLEELAIIIDLYKLRDMPDQAILFSERSVKILESNNSSNKLSLAEQINSLAGLYENKGNSKKAHSLYKKARNIYSAEPKK